MFVTAFVGIFDLKTAKIEFVNAGHCPPLLQSKKKYAYVDVCKNMVLGVKDGYDFKIEQMTLHKNDRLFLYTDGVTEAQTVDAKMFGTERLLDVLNKKEMSLSETLDCVHKSIKKFIKDAPQFDDITMMVVEFKHKK
jgi:sigma-B regulation protein RsbU (phosphoserine phosphatase)